METIDELLERCEQAHGHLCPGQLLGVRMALLGCDRLGIKDPRGSDKKKLIVWVEIDRCMTDAVSAVTGTRLGKRTLKFLDYGKVAATFLNLDTGEAVRIVARESSEIWRTAGITVNEMDLPGHPRSRVICQECGEGINDARELNTVDVGILCHSCAFGTYYQTKSAPSLVVV